jgi:Zn-dependent protease with chaperone function
VTDGSGGFILALLTDSFAVRAFVGTLAAALLSMLTIRFAPIRSPRGRRMLVLAPVITAIVAAVASVGSAFLPTVWVMGAPGSADTALEMLGQSGTMAPRRDVSVLLAVYLLIASVLLVRRGFGALTVRRMLRQARCPERYERPVRTVQRLSAKLGIRTPEVRFVPRCPGGAFTAGRRRPVVALDPALVATLDDRELEGLVAHELAHLRRADPLTCLAVGITRDAAFFLPGVHLAARWLREEQEESADELAATLTHRPAALASGILKVWQQSQHRAPPTACAAAGASASWRWLPARLVPAGLTPWPAVDPAGVIKRRVERLISALPSTSGRRRRTESVIGVVVTVIAVVTALLAPTWLSHRHTDLLGFFYLTNEAPSAAESPAFATFRALAPESATSTHDVLSGVAFGDAAAPALGESRQGESRQALQHDGGTAMCPCVATPSQLAAAQSAAPGEGGMSWGSHAWERQRERNEARLQANRRLLLMDSTEQQFGFLTAGRRTRALDERIPMGVR